GDVYVAHNPLFSPPGCGNGQVEGSEGCDDGNTVACDGCSPTCQPEVCGNGVVECSEQCDAGTANGTLAAGCDQACHPCRQDTCSCSADTDCDPGGRCAGVACQSGSCVTVPRELGLDVDGNGRVDVATDIVYVARYLLGLTPVPAS